ncbi:MAG TPA: sialidase family protein, partial [Chloroflexota bacterium]|nr:sialidase family protein [Chloroflexota bacterium]
ARQTLAPRSRTGAVGAQALVVAMVESTDGGRHFGRATTPGPTVFGLAPAAGLLVPTGPSLATDPRDGSVYAVYTVAHPGPAPADDIVLAHSRNGGRTWTTAAPVTPGPGADHAVYFQPRVVIDGAGSVAVSYLVLAHGRVDVMLARPTTHGVLRQRITSRSFDPALGLPGDKEGLWWIGDYQGLAAGPRMIYPCWSDTRTGHLEIVTATVPGVAPR